MISHATEMYQTGTHLLRLASLVLAGNGHEELGRSLVDAGMRMVEGAKTGRCPCEWAGLEDCQHFGEEQDHRAS